MRSVVFAYLAALSIGYWFMASPVLENTRNVYNLPSSSALLCIDCRVCSPVRDKSRRNGQIFRQE
uniref:Uncharacterized protein n=1 Tax=Globisporangium ultimum (strain ATCC 200006 / CBS 805.95 / DAOM BR144) TaxID=431595 RepID=K3WQK9_GLOUD